MRPPTSSRSRFLPRPTGFQENRSSRKKSCCSKLGSQSVGPDAAILHPLGNFLETVGQFFLMFYLLLGTLGANFLTFGPNLFTKWHFFAKLWLLFHSKHPVTLTLNVGWPSLGESVWEKKTFCDGLLHFATIEKETFGRLL